MQSQAQCNAWSIPPNKVLSDICYTKQKPEAEPELNASLTPCSSGPGLGDVGKPRWTLTQPPSGSVGGCREYCKGEQRKICMGRYGAVAFHLPPAVSYVTSNVEQERDRKPQRTSKLHCRGDLNFPVLTHLTSCIFKR